MCIKCLSDNPEKQTFLSAGTLGGRFVFSILFLMSLFPYSFGQQGKKMAEYTPEFKFKEGIYIAFDQVKNNKPVIRQRIITKVEGTDIDYFSKVLTAETMQYFDDFGIQQTIKTNEVWGYCRKGMVFINWQGEFNRVPVIGNIAYFAAVVSVSATRFPDPYDNFYPGMGSPDTPQEEMRQYLIDFETGLVLDYSIDNVLVLLQKDPELHDEFKALKKRKKKNMTFVYVRRYNEKHPISFPVD